MFLENITGQTMYLYFLRNEVLLSAGGGGQLTSFIGTYV